MKKSFESITANFRFFVICLLVGTTVMSVAMPEGNSVTFFTLWDNCPTANFTVSNNGCIGPCAIVFTNQSSGATSYEWDFGDGNTSSEINPTHSYQSPGTYTVKLTAIVEGCAVPFIGTVDIVGN